MNNIYRAREEAFKLASQKYENKTPNYTTYSPIYIASTSNVTDTMKLYKNYDKVLAVGSTGAHGYEAILNGATSVDLFDINELQRIYFEYMKTAIIYLDYKDFIKHFTLPIQKKCFKKEEINDLLSNELYDKLVYVLPEDVDTVLTPLYEWYYSPDLIISNLFRFEYLITLNYLKKNVSFYNEEEYYRLQKILRKESCEINYHILSLTEVPTHFSEQYDLIVLDNILQYYKDILGLETPYLVNMFIDKKLSNLLADNGTIQVNYGFEVASDAFKERFNIPYNKENLNFIETLIMKREMKEGINIPLAEKSDKYSYNFIPGVERNERKNSNNLVLSYRKNK